MGVVWLGKAIDVREGINSVAATGRVRLASPADEPALYALLVDLHRGNRSGWAVPYDPSIVAAQIEVGTRINPETRTNPLDKRAGWIGVVDGHNGDLIASVGLFLDTSAWFTRDCYCLVELWLFVRKPERDKGARHERALFAFAEQKHAEMKEALAKQRYPYGFELRTGFLHQGPRFDAMARLWRRMSGARPAGMLFTRH